MTVDRNVYTDDGYDVTKVLITEVGEVPLCVQRDGDRYCYKVQMPDGSGKFSMARTKDEAWAAAERAMARLVEDMEATR